MSDSDTSDSTTSASDTGNSDTSTSDTSASDTGNSDTSTSDFRWGVTSSSVSAEGVAPGADWSTWERDGRVPPSGDGSGFRRDFRDDIGQFVDLGCSDWRITVEWARIEPEPGRIDSDAVDWYVDVLAHARASGLRSWVTLHHGSLPGWYVDDEGGHRDETARGRWWARHVDRMAETLDGVADGWVPIDDPIGWAVRGYLLGSRPPGRRDPVAAHEAVFGAVMAVEESVRLLASGRQPVMTAWRADPVRAAPLDDGRIAPEAHAAADRWDALLWGTWLRAHAEGTLHLEGRAATPVPSLLSEVDVVGLVHDHPVGVDAGGSLGSWPASAPRAADGFAPEPDELGEAIDRAASSLPDFDVAIAGHGIPTGDDGWRDELLVRSLAHVVEAADDGRLVGYFHDSGVDGYEWSLGFAGPRGLIDRERRVKPSAERFRSATTATGTHN
jgi:beta-glucosidase